MNPEEAQLDNPIDAMLLIHKALRNEATRVEEMVRRFQIGSSLQPIRGAFNFWAAALAFHAEQEDQHMTAIMPDFQPARDAETEHVALAKIMENLSTFLDRKDTGGLAERVNGALVALNQRQHLELVEKLEDVMVVLNQEIGKTRVIARTQRHLYGKVVALRIAQDDHLESEEAFVLPEIRQRFGEAEQLKIVSQLLIDAQAEDQRWVLDWVAQNVTPAERRLLADLEAQMVVLPDKAD